MAEEHQPGDGLHCGFKKDKGKLRYDLLPFDAMDELVRVYTIGAEKYDDRNWERGMAWGRTAAALMRHVSKWMQGERHDPVDGQYHMASVAWCALTLLAYELRSVGQDDRGKTIADAANIVVPQPTGENLVPFAFFNDTGEGEGC